MGKKTNQSAHVKHNPMFDATAAGAAGNAEDATAIKPDMDVEPSSAAAPKAKKKKKGSTKTPSATSAAKITVSLKAPFGIGPVVFQAAKKKSSTKKKPSVKKGSK